MKKSRFSERQIIAILESVEAGRTARDVCRERGISSGAFHAWKSEFGGWKLLTLSVCGTLKYENARLKQSKRVRLQVDAA